MDKTLEGFLPKYADDSTTPTLDYNEKEKIYRGYMIERINSARVQRDGGHIEFDDMDYLTNYETNLRAGNMYSPPRRNRYDTRIVTGTTHEKENTLLSALLNYNLEPTVTAFDEEDYIINELGENLEDMIKKSREMEEYDDKRPLIYKELLDQGTCFVEEVYVERFRVEKDTKNFDWSEGMKVSGAKWDARLKKVYKGCEAQLLPGTKVYLGNFKEFFIKKQPFLFTIETMTYNEARTMYGEWERWKYVPKKVVHFSENFDYIDYRNWTLLDSEEDTVEIIKYQDKWNNEFQLLINGVMMLPVGFPLTAISPSGEYTIAKGDVEPIPFCAYSKSIPAKTKVDQQIFDEFLKTVVLKFQQSAQPPMANNTKVALSKNIFMAGTIHNDVDPSKLQPIIPGGGLTDGELRAFDIIKGIIDSKSVSPIFSGETSAGSQTATEIMELKKQSMMKLGLLIWGVMSLERQLAWLRLQNILCHWTKPIDSKIDEVTGQLTEKFRTISVETTLETGRKGRKIIAMDPQMTDMMTPEHIKAEEEFLSEQLPTRKVYMNPKALAQLKATYFITINPTEKNTSELRRVLFEQNLKTAMMLWPQDLNQEYAKERFAVLAGEDPDKFFNKVNPAMESLAGGPPAMPNQNPNMPQPAIQSQMMPSTPAQPSLNTLQNA